MYLNNIYKKTYNFTFHPQELLLRVPTHEIAAICYIRDDSQHILALKYGKLEDIVYFFSIKITFFF